MFAGCIEKKSTSSMLGPHFIQQINGDGSSHGLAQCPFENAGFWQGEFARGYSVTLVEQNIYHKQNVCIQINDDLLIAGWYRIDNLDELRSQLQQTEQCSEKHIIAEAYRLWGKKLCDQLVGDFTFVIVDLAQHQCLLLRDHLGVRPLYYYQDDSRLVFASSIAAFIDSGLIKGKFSQEYLARYCFSVATDWQLTAYESILKLPPAHYACVTIDNFSKEQELSRLKPIRYFEFDSAKRYVADSEETYIQRYRQYLEEAVRCRVADIGDVPLACESSGGIDSSTVTALAAKYVPNSTEKLKAYGFVTEVEEEACIQQMSDFLDLKTTRLIKDNPEDMQLILQANQELSRVTALPVTAYIALAHKPIYQRAKGDGAKVLLSGFGGDEFVTVYGATARVELFKRREWQQWFELFPGGKITKRLRAFKWLLRLFLRRNTFETASALLRGNRFLLRHHVFEEPVLDRYNIEEISTSRSSYDAGCASVNEFSLTNRWSPDMVARLEECSLMAAAQGLEYRWPLLDIRLIEFFLSVPSEYKLRAGVPRYLHRQAIIGLIPDPLIWKDKSMGGSIASQGDAMRSYDESMDHTAIQFEHLHEDLQPLIAKAKWQNTLVQAARVSDAGKQQSAVWQWFAIIQPVLSLSQWLKGGNTD